MPMDRPAAEILRLDGVATAQFQTWLKMVSDPKKLKRWEKYIELCPARELLIQDAQGDSRRLLRTIEVLLPQVEVNDCGTKQKNNCVNDNLF